MSSTRILLVHAIIFGLSQPISVARAEIQQAAAAGYIRALFDANMMPGADATRICPDVAGFGRFAVGHAWQGLPPDERHHFAAEFCKLAGDAVARLRNRWPELRLIVEQTSAGPQELQIVSGLVRQPGGISWPVEWTVAFDNDRAPRLADLKVLGVSLGIFLRSLTLLQQDRPARADQLVDAWRQALDRALPPTEPAHE